MNCRQREAAERLKKALDHCHKVWLEGGVYSGLFCVWPKKAFDVYETGSKFFDAVREHGAIIESPMTLDGGAGV